MRSHATTSLIPTWVRSAIIQVVLIDCFTLALRHDAQVAQCYGGCCCAEYRTVGGVSGPLVIVEHVKVRSLDPLVN